MNKKFENLKSQHDGEVKELFENKNTLRFVKQMVFYKKNLLTKQGDEEMKNIST